MTFAGLQKVSLTDFPGHIAAILFTQGCNLRCPYCHNPALIPPTRDEGFSWDEVRQFLENRQGKLDGVAITGGEPLLHAGLIDAARAILDMGFALKLDTNGTLPQALSALLKQARPHYIAMDIKGGSEYWSRLSGNRHGFDAWLESLHILAENRLPFELRVTMLPALHTPESLEEISRLLQDFKDVPLYLQTLSGEATLDPDLAQSPPFSKDELSHIRQQYFSHHTQCHLRV